MTAIVGILCDDGVVIGADSSATFGAGEHRTIEQPTHKIRVLNDQLVVACTGAVGLAQRFEDVCSRLYAAKSLNTDAVEIGRCISKAAIADFMATSAHFMGAPRNNYIGLGALVAGHHHGRPYLIEFEVGTFQPEVKMHGSSKLWFASMGSGQSIADPFLALLRRTLSADGPPKLAKGRFMVAWTVAHVCDTNPGGVKEPYHLALIEQHDGKFRARELEETEMAEHQQNVKAAEEYLKAFPEAAPGAPPIPA